MDSVRRAGTLFLTLLMLLVPAVQLTSPLSGPVAHQVSAKTISKAGSRILGVTADALVVSNGAPAVDCVMIVEPQEIRPGFSASPFVPPRF